MTARREWGAAGRDVAQVREGAETARGESEWRGRCAEETRVCPRGEWGVRSGVGGVWKKRGCAREGSGAVRSGVDSLRK